MKKYLKVLTMLTTVAMLSSVTAGCSKKEVTDAKPKDVTLRFQWWGGDDRHKATLAAIDKYTSLHPNVKITGEYGGYDGYYQKMATQLSGGTAADIMQIDPPWLADLTAQGELFADINTLKSIDTSGFDKKFLKDFCEANGKLVGLPSGMSAATTIYNKDVFTKFNIPETTVWNWDNILEMGKAVHEKDPKYYLLAQDVSVCSNMIISYVRQKTGKQWVNDDYTVGFDKALMTDAYSYLRKLIDNGVIQKFEESILFDNKYDQSPQWMNKQMGMTFNWSSLMSLFKKDTSFNLAMSEFPVAKDAKTTAIQVRPAQIFSINKRSQNTDEAAKFINWFLNDKDSIDILNDARGVPATVSGRERLVSTGKLDKAVDDGVKIALKNAGDPFNNISNNTELDKISRDVIQKVAFNKLTPDKAADDLIKRFNDKLAELKSQKK